MLAFQDSQQELFNPNCKNIMLIENMKKRCNCKDKGKSNVMNVILWI